MITKDEAIAIILSINTSNSEGYWSGGSNFSPEEIRRFLDAEKTLVDKLLKIYPDLSDLFEVVNYEKN